MDEPFYRSRVSLEMAGPLHRRAHLPLGATADMGVHGSIVQLFKLSPSANSRYRWTTSSPPPRVECSGP